MIVSCLLLIAEDGGDLQLYLEKLSSAPNVQEFVKKNSLFSQESDILTGTD